LRVSTFRFRVSIAHDTTLNMIFHIQHYELTSLNIISKLLIWLAKSPIEIRKGTIISVRQRREGSGNCSFSNDYARMQFYLEKMYTFNEIQII
jgi:hypothetical protein